MSQSSNCPVCGANLDNGLQCSRCGFQVEEPRKPIRWMKWVLIPLGVVAIVLLIWAGLNFFASKVEIVDGHFVVDGVEGGAAYVPAEDYPRWLELRKELLRTRKMLERRKQMKVNVYGDLDEERRLERIITTLGNEASKLVMDIHALEKGSPSGGQPSPAGTGAPTLSPDDLP